MVAQLKIIKYTGKSYAFGTEVSSLGIKRVDAAVPAVYGSTPAPGDDASDVLRYPVLLPQDATTAYSFESIFKLHLKVAPDNQLSNIRIYPDGDAPTDANAPKLFIGVSQAYSRPTNSESIIAVNDIWDYTEEDPFLITIAGLSGYEVSPEVFQVYEYQITVADTGSGNRIYLNGDKQPSIKIILDNEYTFINNVTDDYTFQVYDPDGVEVTHADIVYGTSGSNQIITITASANLLATYPDGFLYGSDVDSTIGGTISWFDVSDVPTETITYDVEINTYSGLSTYYYFFDGKLRPILNLSEGKIYVFNNHSGDTNPLRFFGSGYGGSEEGVIVDGITVTNGGTVNEVVTLNTSELISSGKTITTYQSTTSEDYGNAVYFVPLDSEGKYNMNTVGAGTSDPTAAGETDYVFLQLAVTKDTTPGSSIPNLIIKYDES